MRRRPWGWGTLLGALLVLAPLAGFTWYLHRVQERAGPSPPAPGIAVLTGGPDRVEEGLALLAERPGTRLIVSGAGGDAPFEEFARRHGADPAPLAGRAVLGRQARSTRGNAREVAEWARREGLREVVVITAGFHMPRAILELGRAMPEVTLHPHPVAPHLARPVPLLREFAKLSGAALGLSALADRG